jgi:Na+/phosphate symporter
MLLLKLGTRPLLSDPAARGAVAEIARIPFAAFGAAILGTAVLQSSASVMALAVTVAISGALPQSAVFPVALGSHLGSAAAMLLAAMGGRRNARMLGLAAFLYKLAGTAVFLPFLAWAEALLDRLGFPVSANLVLAQILIALVNAAIFYAWPEPLIHGAAFLLSFARGASLGVPVYLDEKLLKFPSLAVGLLAKEMIRLANYIEAFLQMVLFPETGEEDLKSRLPGGIRELADACEQYMYLIRPPSIAEDREAGREYRTISYAMLSLRESARIVTGRFREAVERRGIPHLTDETGGVEWRGMARDLLEIVRDAFHAFSLGDAVLAQKALNAAMEFDGTVRNLRSRLLTHMGRAGRRERSVLVDFVLASDRILHSALEVARGDAGTEIGNEGGRSNSMNPPSV